MLIQRMLRRLDEYLLCSVTRSYKGQKFNRHKACWYDVGHELVNQVNLLVVGFQGELVEGEPIEYQLDHSSFLKKQWSPLCIHLGEETCWLLQQQSTIFLAQGYVQLYPLERREWSLSLYGIYIVPQWCHKEEVLEHMDGCIWVIFSTSRSVPTMVHGMVKEDLH